MPEAPQWAQPSPQHWPGAKDKPGGRRREPRMKVQREEPRKLPTGPCLPGSDSHTGKKCWALKNYVKSKHWPGTTEKHKDGLENLLTSWKHTRTWKALICPNRKGFLKGGEERQGGQPLWSVSVQVVGSAETCLGKKEPFSILTSEETEASLLRVTVLVCHRFTIKTVRCQARECSLCTIDGGCWALLYPRATHRSGPGHFWWVQAFQDPRWCRTDTYRDAGSGIPRSPTAEAAR